MNTVKKGDELEEKFYQYLLDQKNRGHLVCGIHPAHLCKIYKQKKYYCKTRESYVTFDIVIELNGEGRTKPYLTVLFECKNFANNVPESELNDFSVKVNRIFGHSAKAVMVVSSPLQSGAATTAKNTKMGVVKYDENGFETIIDRKGNSLVEKEFLKSQIIKDTSKTKALKFSAYHNGNLFGSIGEFLDDLTSTEKRDSRAQKQISIDYISDETIKNSVQNVLEKINYKSGSVDLCAVCALLSIELNSTNEIISDENGHEILGSANFDQKTILIHDHKNKSRERFTIAHEIGHFYLKHDRYLRSESIIESDLFNNNHNNNAYFNYERLEFQANAFAAHLLLPENHFIKKTCEYRSVLDIRDRGNGFIYVDDQPCNIRDYLSLLSRLSSYFNVSQEAIEVKFKKMNILTDERKHQTTLPVSTIMDNAILNSKV